MLQQLVTEIQLTVQDLFAKNKLEFPNDLHIEVEQPQRIAHGDYALNIAMKLAKHFRKPPIHIANDIVNELKNREIFHTLVEKVEVVPPGFINFFLSWNIFGQAGEQVVLPNTNEKVIIEHTSINPNKAAHIGHLRNSCIGDMLSRLFRNTGHEVEVHNYIDDLGNQLADTVVGLLNIPVEGEYDRFGDYCWDIYSKVNQAYQEDQRLQEKRSDVLHSLEEGKDNIAWQGLLVAERIVRDHLEEMAGFGIDYDLLVWESNIVREGFWASAFEILKQSDRFVKETSGKLAGCWVLKQTDTNEGTEADHQQDKVLVRSNGILTYTAKDIAYHMWKFGLLPKDFTYHIFTKNIWTTTKSGIQKSFGKASKVVNVIDFRQEYPQAMVRLALETLGFQQAANNLKHVNYGVVSLSKSTAEMLGIDTTDGKVSYAMSGRQGIGIKITELLDRMEKVIEKSRTRESGISSREIALAAVRYYLLRFGVQTEIVFDLDLATEVSGNTGVYLLYSYARGNNILNKATSITITKPSDLQVSDLHVAERTLLRHMITWPSVVESTLRELAPNLICNYAFELASLFNNFYTQCPVLKENETAKQNFRLWLTSTFTKHLADVLNIIGLPTPTEM